ncbi:MAG TPA: ABC-F family ATP-binding cassette domain-containing protein [Chthoniobacteraceae bacterium]|jgi:ATP-binding cassette subfamily F protein uup|nr:ABC-F family ATP-binding cassette domain-containing protein [Chthoniobacteraceae bacterium]
MSIAVLSASEITIRYGVHTVLDRATLSINQNDRVGLVGRNGTGKSTFLRVAAGEIEPDSGAITRQRDLLTGYLPQSFELVETARVDESILGGAQHVVDMIEEYENAPGDSLRSGELMEKIEHFQGWTIDGRIKSLISNLHAPDADRIVGTLSGGEKRRVALCRALIAQPDLLILDEPTNHLDTEAIEWLENFLASYPGACLLVTHDRYFLDRISTRIVELARGNFLSYEGNYSDFLIAKAERTGVEEQQEKKRQKFLKSELAWVRRKPSARRTKSVDRIERYFTAAAQGPPEQEMDVELVIPPAPQTSNRVIELTDLHFKQGDRTLIEKLTLNIAPDVRIGIVGRNGLGKTTLLRLILGQLQPQRGRVEIGGRTQINYVDQNRLTLDETKTIWEEVGEGLEYVRLGEENVSLRAYLRRFLFTEDQINSKIQLLSGGERSRVVLAKILKRGGNVLILDEPTNDLDLATLRLLEEALCLYKGAVLLVSHDRWFLNRVCTHTLAFEGDGKIFYDAGDYDNYLEKRARRQAARSTGSGRAPVAPPPIAAPVKSAPKVRKFTWKENKEWEGMEAAIAEAEAEVARLEALFAAPDFYEKHGSDAAALQLQLDAARGKVPALYSRWSELEKIQAGG